ncbi:MAG: mannose-6-phosphate isomerase, partial [Actinomycetota bacterium]
MTASGRHSSYERFPYIPSGPRRECAAGWDAICAALGGSGARVVVVDAYTGVAGSDLLSLVKGLDPELSIPAGDALRSPEEIERMLHPYVTDDPVFGRIAELGLLDLFDPHRLRLLREEIEACEGRVVVYGAGASLLADGDVLVYADMPRREEVLRQRRHESAPLGASRPRDDPALAYKRSFFVDWRICDAHRRALLGRADHVLDTTAAGAPKMIEGRTLLRSLHDLARRPFRVVPFFDPAPWGGRWLMEVCDLDRDAVNYGWAFDCVPEENSLLLGFGDARFETPALNLVHQAQEPLLGPHVLETFGAEFPIRFDFLDTMEGGNLSLQVHPTSRYIGETFGMRYTQDESYYLMDAAPDAGV